MQVLQVDETASYQQLVGVGGLGTGIFFALEGEHALGRSESRPGRLLDVRDYCKLQIVSHYVAKLLGNYSFRVFPIGKIGNDAAGQFVLKELADAGIDTRFVQRVTGRPTLFSVCFQYPDGTGAILRPTIRRRTSSVRKTSRKLTACLLRMARARLHSRFRKFPSTCAGTFSNWQPGKVRSGQDHLLRPKLTLRKS